MFVPGFNSLEDSVGVTGRDDGIVTMYARFTFESIFVEALDSVLGTKALPESMKMTILDAYLERYGASIDTTDKQNLWAEVVAKLKVTSEGIQEFVNSGGDLSRPLSVPSLSEGTDSALPYRSEHLFVSFRERTRARTLRIR